MSLLLMATVALGAVIFPCLIAFACMPQDDGRRF